MRIPRLAAAALVILVLGGGAPARATTTWEGVLPNPMPSQDNTIFQLAAVDGTHAWAVGARSSGGNNEVVMLRTENGSTWTQVSLPSAGGSMFPLIVTAMVFVDTDRGYVAAGQLQGLSMAYKIHETTDGGGSWTEVATTTGEISHLQALPGGEIFGVGSGGVVKSTDGQTWSEVTVDEPATDVTPVSVAMLNDTCGWLVGGLPADSDAGRPNAADGAVWHTEDGGQTWTVRAQGLPFYLRAASFVAGDLGWGVGQQGGSQGVLAVTQDGGSTWTPVSVPDHPALPDVCLMSQCLDTPTVVSDMTGVRFWDATRGIASGVACTGGCGAGEDPSFLTVFLRTYDGGTTWTYDEDYEAAMPDVDMQMLTLPGEMAGLYRMSFPDPNHGFLAGEMEMILRYDADWIEDPAQVPPACDSTAAGDGGIVPQPDGGVPGDAGGPNPEADDRLSGCGCRTGTPPGAALPWLLSLGALLFRLRRRRP